MSNSSETFGINLFIANNLKRPTTVKPGGETVQQFEHKTPPSPLPKKEDDPPKKEEDPVVDPPEPPPPT